jgi:hypothetical protein
MTRSTLLLAVVTAALGLGTAYLYRQHTELSRGIALDWEQCAQRIARLQSEHQARLAELERHLMQTR